MLPPFNAFLITTSMEHISNTAPATIVYFIVISTCIVLFVLQCVIVSWAELVTVVPVY